MNVTEAGGDTTISIDTTGSSTFTELVVLENATGADLNTLRANETWSSNNEPGSNCQVARASL